MQTLGSEQVRTAEEQLSEQQQDMKQALKAVQKQSSDWTEDELQQDVPTGQTVNHVQALSSRIPKACRWQDFCLHVFLSFIFCIQDSMEDEMSTCNQSLAMDPDFDKNLVFNESDHVLFKVSCRRHLSKMDQSHQLCDSGAIH